MVGEKLGFGNLLKSYHNPIFTPGIFSGVNMQNETTQTQAGLIRRGLATSNNLKMEFETRFPEFDQV
jgi:hypothetical protein